MEERAFGRFPFLNDSLVSLRGTLRVKTRTGPKLLKSTIV